jgi:hypothetical protein
LILEINASGSHDQPPTTPGGSDRSLRQSDAAHEVLEARFGAQGVVVRPNFEVLTEVREAHESIKLGRKPQEKSLDQCRARGAGVEIWSAPAERSADGALDTNPFAVIQSGVALRLPPHSKFCRRFAG